jgi:putative ABC transport system substrate-binding protein
VRRREFFSILGGAAACPIAARAQQGERVRRIGVLMASAENDPQGQAYAAALQSELRGYGWTEGGNLQIAWRWAGGDIGRFRDYAGELVGLMPDLLFAVGTSSVAMLKQATRSIPIIFAIVNDPVAQGFISSMAHPGGNITGFSFLEYSTLGKSLEMLKEVMPRLIRAAVMFNPETYPYYNIFLRSFEASARKIGIELQAGQIRTPAEIEEVIGKLSRNLGADCSLPPIRSLLPIATRLFDRPRITAFPRFIHFAGMCRKAP